MQSMDEISTALITAALPPRAYVPRSCCVSVLCKLLSASLRKGAFERDFKAEREGE